MQHTRHNSIKDLVVTTGFVNVQELAEKFGVTTETIRRDLEQLEREGLVRRVRGGAVSIQPVQVQNESAFTLRKESFAEEKQAIAELAAEMVYDGDTIIIAPGTTALEVAKKLKGKKDVTVITNSLPVAIELADVEGITVFCLGGFVKSEDFSVSGNISIDNLNMFNASKLITGVGGLTIENGLTDYRMDESSLLISFFDKTDIAIGVADHTKIGRVARYNICPAKRLDYLITADTTPASEIQAFEEIGVKVKVTHL